MEGPRLMDRVRGKLRAGHYSHLTEKAYVTWIRRFILFHGKQHPLTLGPAHVEAFLTDLAINRRVASPTQNQALNALLFLYRRVLEVELPWLDGVIRAKKPARLPVVLSSDEVASVLAELRDVYWLIGALLYGSGLRLMECLRLRVKDIDLDARQLTVRSGKGEKDRVTLIAAAVIPALEQHLARRREQHRADCARGSASGLSPRRAGSKISEREPPMGLAIPVRGGSRHRAARQQAFGAMAPARTIGPARDSSRHPPRRHLEACELSHAAAQLRHAPAPTRPRTSERSKS